MNIINALLSILFFLMAIIAVLSIVVKKPRRDANTPQEPSDLQ